MILWAISPLTGKCGPRILPGGSGGASWCILPEANPIRWCRSTGRYRAITRAVETAVIQELLNGPLEGNKQVIPYTLKELGINVSASEDSPVVTVDLPSGFDGSTLDSTQQLLLIYSIVNSLTDKTNLPTVNRVQFTVGREDGGYLRHCGYLQAPGTQSVADPAVSGLSRSTGAVILGRSFVVPDAGYGCSVSMLPKPKVPSDI